jgi:DNA-binding IclR family transcriptional regulator
MRTFASGSSDISSAAVKSADRVLDLFELLAQGGRDMSHTEISEVLRIPKSSLSQLLKTLVARSYLEVTSTGRGYRLGQAFLKLSDSIGRARDLVSLAGPFLEEVTRETGESSALNQIKGDMAEVTATVLGPARLVTHMRPGDLAPLYAISGGKAILAHMPDEFQRQYLANVRFEPVTPETLKSVGALKKQLASIRASGFAYSREEWTPGIVGIATAVLGADGYVLGAINVAIPVPRFNEAAQTKCEHALSHAVGGLRRLLVPRR